MQELQRVLSRCLGILGSANESSMMQSDMDYLLVIRTMEEQLLDWRQEWMLSRGPPPVRAPTAYALTHRARPDAPNGYQRDMGIFYFHYALLVVNSFGLQNAIDRAPANVGHFFARTHTAASACAALVRDTLGAQGVLRYSPDSHFVFASYAVLSLLKVRPPAAPVRRARATALTRVRQLLRPEFHASPEQEAKTLALVTDVAGLLEGVAAGPAHTPALYAAFLRALVADKLAPAPARSPSPDAPAMPTPNGNGNGIAGARTPEPAYAHAPPALAYAGFAGAGEMGALAPADTSTFPPVLAAPDPGADELLNPATLFAAGFWDSVLVPGASRRARSPPAKADRWPAQGTGT
jgi:hypothetical protein